MTGRLSVLKIGGSVLRDERSFAVAARFLHTRLTLNQDERLVVIVSAQYGTTDYLEAEAQTITDSPSQTALDLLWSTGEVRSVALLALHLQRAGVSAVPFNVHQAGLVADRMTGTSVRPLRLLAALAHARIVIVPGFLGVSAGGAIASLGRGGSDLTAVLLASAIRADACELIKDVAGYYTADPNRDPHARQIHHLSNADAIRMADAGCDLVQRAALAAASKTNLEIIVRSMDADAPVTHVYGNERTAHHGIRDENDPRGPAVGA
jgi:aspartate kinase